MNIIFIAILFLFFAGNAYPVNYNNDANCMGSWGMEGNGGDNETEPDLSGENGDLDESAGDEIELNTTDKKFGSASRDFEYSDSENLSHADGNSTDIGGADQDLTMCGYVRSEGDPGAFCSLGGKADYGANETAYFVWVDYANDDFAHFVVSNDGSNETDAEGTTDMYPNSSTWFFLCGVYDDSDAGQEVQVWVNASQEGTADHSSAGVGVSNNDARFSVGSVYNNGSTSRWWDGEIDEVSVFDRVLSSVEQADIRDNGMTGGAAAEDMPQVIIIANGIETSRTGQIKLENWKEENWLWGYKRL